MRMTHLSHMWILYYPPCISPTHQRRMEDYAPWSATQSAGERRSGKLPTSTELNSWSSEIAHLPCQLSEIELHPFRLMIAGMRRLSGDIPHLGHTKWRKIWSPIACGGVRRVLCSPLPSPFPDIKMWIYENECKLQWRSNFSDLRQRP